jgi:hypothetical protein
MAQNALTQTVVQVEHYLPFFDTDTANGGAGKSY